jgi:hypothetical protein
MIHPFDAASNTHFFVSVSKARKETFAVTAPLIATAGVVPAALTRHAPIPRFHYGIVSGWWFFSEDSFWSFRLASSALGARLAADRHRAYQG